MPRPAPQSPEGVVETVEITAVTERTSEFGYVPEPPRPEVPDPGASGGLAWGPPPPPQVSLWDLVVQHAEAWAARGGPEPQACPPDPG
jgi:hypothetical protein